MNSENLKIGLVGATGAVGSAFINLLKSSSLKIGELRPFASPKSEGKLIKEFNSPIQTLKDKCFDGLDIVFFSSGDEISLEWAPKAVESGAFAVDNSAAFRMNPNNKLIVPEVNGHLIKAMNSPEIIANPNCSTIQLMLPLNALKPFGLKKVVVSTYQAASGAGTPGIDELLEQTQKGDVEVPPKNFAKPIAYNCIPQIGSFKENSFTSEEIKLMRESRKILDLPELNVSAFAVRVPVMNGHSETVWLSFNEEVSREQILSKLNDQLGLEVFSHPTDFDTPKERSEQHDVSVSRLHQDLYNPNTWLMWVVGDNLLKGAALNGFQIAEKIVQYHA